MGLMGVNDYRRNANNRLAFILTPCRLTNPSASLLNLEGQVGHFSPSCFLPPSTIFLPHLPLYHALPLVPQYSTIMLTHSARSSSSAVATPRSDTADDQFATLIKAQDDTKVKAGHHRSNTMLYAANKAIE